LDNLARSQKKIKPTKQTNKKVKIIGYNVFFLFFFLIFLRQ